MDQGNSSGKAGTETVEDRKRIILFSGMLFQAKAEVNKVPKIYP